MDWDNATQVVAHTDLVACDLADQTAILNLQSGVYFGLNTVGTRVWTMIQQPALLGDVVSALMEEYDVGAARCQSDVVKLFSELHAHGLIRVL